MSACSYDSQDRRVSRKFRRAQEPTWCAATGTFIPLAELRRDSKRNFASVIVYTQDLTSTEEALFAREESDSTSIRTFPSIL